MMRLPPFEYLSPGSVAEATELLAEHGTSATLLAGGTDLFPKMKRRQQEPSFVIGLRRLAELRGVAPLEDGWIRVGAMTRLDALSGSRALVDTHPALGVAAGLVSTPHLRAMGTIGGNLALDTRCTYYDQTYAWRRSIDFCMKKEGATCWVAPGSPRCWAVSSSDCAPVAIALDASVRLASVRGYRSIPAVSLYRDDGIEYLAKGRDEIITDLLLPPSVGRRAVYWKVRRRNSFDFPVLGVAVSLSPEGDLARGARLVLGAVGSSPVLVEEVGDLLEGERVTEAILDEAANLAAKRARPLDNTDLGYAWRKRMTRVYVRRAIRDAMGMPPVGGIHHLTVA